MTSEDTKKLLMITREKLYSEFGLMGDLPYELANSIANVYWRYFEFAMIPSMRGSTEEMAIRTTQFEAIPGAIAEFRRLQSNGATKSMLNAMAFWFVSMCKYRISDADKKTPARCMIERLYRKSYDIPDLVKTLLLYQ